MGCSTTPLKAQISRFGSSERMHTTSLAAAVAVAKGFRARLNAKLRRNEMINGSCRFMKSEYKQISVHNDQLRFVVIAIFDPTVGRWRYVIRWALPFGLAGAVLHFTARLPLSQRCVKDATARRHKCAKAQRRKGTTVQRHIGKE